MSDENPIEFCEHEPLLDPVAFDIKKKLRIGEIDKRTGELIAQGFVYDNTLFSLSVLAQTNWIGLKQAAQNDLVSYPFGVTTKDDDEYTFNNKDEVTSFYITGLGTKITHLATGRALKIAVKATTNETELDAVVDNR